MCWRVWHPGWYYWKVGEPLGGHEVISSADHRSCFKSPSSVQYPSAFAACQWILLPWAIYHCHLLPSIRGQTYEFCLIFWTPAECSQPSCFSFPNSHVWHAWHASVVSSKEAKCPDPSLDLIRACRPQYWPCWTKTVLHHKVVYTLAKRKGGGD